MRRISVLLVSPAPPPVGGIARWTEQVLRYARDHPSVLISHLDSAVRERSVHDKRLAARVVAGAAHAKRIRRSLISALASTKPDVVHLTTSGSLGTVRDLALIRACERADVPVVYHVRFGRLPDILRGRGWEAMLLKAAIKRASATVVLDERSRSAVAASMPQARCRTLPNPVMPEALEWEASGPTSILDGLTGRYVLFAGHVTPAKGVTELLHAWHRVQVLGWHLAIAGSAEDSYPLDLINQLHLGGSVILLGELGRGDMRSALARCDIFVLPSHTEGFPNALVEAMSLGRATIATDVGAVPDMLAHHAGVVVPVGDVEALASALSRLMGSPDDRQDLGRAARERARDSYSMDVVFAKYCEVWTTVARSGSLVP